MEKRKHLFDYLGQILIIFGVSMMAISVFCAIVGEEARGYSTMFVLGGKGVPIKTIFQFLLSSICIQLLRILFFTDILIKRMSVVKRTVGMVVSVLILIGVLAAVFGWFPVDDPKCWGCFLISFAICFTVSVLLSTIKERAENRRLAAGLQQLKEKPYEDVDGNP